MIADDETDFAEQVLQPTIDRGVDQLVLRAQNIALDNLIENKLAALRQAGQDLKNSVNSKVDSLMIQANDKRPDFDDANYDEKIKVYENWLDEVTKGVRNVTSFFEQLWNKVYALLNRIFTWIRDGVVNLAKKISKAFHIIKKTLSRENKEHQ